MKTVAYVRATSIYDDSRATKEIIALEKAGYNVIVFAWDRTGKGTEKCNTIFGGKRISFLFYGETLNNGIGMKNITKLLGWFRWVNCMLKKKKIDVVHVCNLDAGVGAYMYCQKRKIPLVYDIYDYYIDSHSIPMIMRPIVEYMEIAMINVAEVTIICTEERREQIAKSKPKKIIVLHNSPEVEVKNKITNNVDYAYCGAFNHRRLLKEILEKYPNNNDISMNFAGYGNLLEMVKKTEECNELFSYLGQLPYSEVLHIEAGAMVLAAIYEPTIRNHRLCAPNKFYEALALGKPIIVCKGTGIDKVVEEYGIGIVIDYDADQFYEAVRMLKEKPTLCYEMGCRARSLYEDRYRWSLMEERLIDAYREFTL